VIVFQLEMLLLNPERRSFTMFSTRPAFSKEVALASAFLALTALTIPARSDELVQLLDPVGPHKPIIASVGDKRVIAFYLPGSNRCAVHAVIGDDAKAPTDTPAVRVRISLEPGQIVHIDTVENKSLNLQCGKNAEDLSIVDTEEAVAFGMTTARPDTLNASTSGF
jgi:hypothetical protein